MAFADVKQQNEYNCAPASAANAVMALAYTQNLNTDMLVNKLAQIMHTDKQGTTSDNFCKGLETV